MSFEFDCHACLDEGTVVLAYFEDGEVFYKEERCQCGSPWWMSIDIPRVRYEDGELRQCADCAAHWEEAGPCARHKA